MTGTGRALILNAKDNVATTLENVKAGERVAAALGDEVIYLDVVEDIPYGFKVARADIALGSEVYKYGEVIGRASKAIGKGQLVHVHNVEGIRGRGDLAARGAVQ
jgi:altronate dehydratase small subunit